MLKNKPNDRWIYVSLTNDPEFGGKGKCFSTEEENLNPQHFKKIAKYRYAFVGTMQEDLNKVMGHDLMKHYAETVSCQPKSIRTKIVYLPAPSLKERFRKWVFETFNITDKLKQKEENDYFASLFKRNY